MKQRSTDRIRARGVVMPRSMLLYAGDVTPALVTMLANVPAGETGPAIQAWLAGGLLEPVSLEPAIARVTVAARADALASATPRQRRTAYAELARAIDDPDATAAQLLAIARAYRDGACHRLAIARYLSAAEGYLERSDRDAARLIFDEIVESMPTHEPELLAVLDLAARCAAVEADFERALALLERLRRLAAICGDRNATVRALLSCAECSLRTDSPDAALAFATRVLDRCGPETGFAGERTAAALAIVEALCDLGRVSEARAAFSDVIEPGVEPESAIAARFHVVAGKLHAAASDPVAAANEFRAAVAAANDALDIGTALAAQRNLASALLHAADIFGAASTLRSARATAAAAGLPAVVAALEVDLAEVQFESGRFPEAVRARADAVAARDTPRLLRLALLVGDRDAIAAWTDFDALEDALAAGTPQRLAAVVPAFAALERHQSDDAAAEARYRRAIDVLEAAGTSAPVDFWCDAAEFGALSDGGRIRAALLRARRTAAPLAALTVELGVLLLDTRQRPADEGLAARADRLATAFLTAGFKARARRTQALAAKTVPSDRGGSVIALIGAGLSNAEIATQLYLSKRTVEKTISDLLRARGLRSRWQLLEAGPRLGLPPAVVRQSGPDDSAASSARLRAEPQR